MNDLHYLKDSKAGNPCYWMGHDGFFWVFEKVGSQEVQLHQIIPVADDVEEGKYHVGLALEELPNAVRGAVVRSPYRMRSRVTSAEEAMSA